MAENTAVEKVKAKTAWDMLERLKPSIASVLPRHLTPGRMAMIAFTAMRRNPKLMECSQESIVGSIMTAAMLGLEPSGPLGHGALIPYWNSRRPGGAGYECQFQPMYQGLLDLARRSGFIKDVQLRAVYKGDTYSYRFGLEPEIAHIPMEGEGADDPDREPTHVYAVIRLNGGGIQWDQMSMAQGIAWGKRYSPSYDPNKKAFKSGSVWADNPLAMILKTILKITLKLCPKSPELSAALLTDDLSDAGKTAVLKKLSDGVYDVEFEEPDMEERPERDHGTVDLATVQPGKEENRGHGKENMGEAAGKSYPKPAPIRESFPNPEGKPKESGPAKQATAVDSAIIKGPDQPQKAALAPVEPAADREPDPKTEWVHNEKPKPAAAAAVNPNDRCTEEQFEILAEARLKYDVEAKDWLAWVKSPEAFDPPLKMASHLKQGQFQKALLWINGHAPKVQA